MKLRVSVSLLCSKPVPFDSLFLVFTNAVASGVTRAQIKLRSGMSLLGGTLVGEGALLRFYVLHCVALPLVIGFLMAVHFWRVRKDGGISGPL